MLDKRKLKKGSGEFISFALTSVFICAIFLYLVAFVQYFIALNAVVKAANVAARSAAVCSSLEDAQELSAMAADSSISISSIGNITTEIAYVSDDELWTSGELITVTTTAEVTTLSPLTSRSVSKSVIVAIESEGYGDYTEEDFIWLASVIQAEAYTSSLQDCIAVGTCVLNRVESSSWPDTIEGVITQANQFSTYPSPVTTYINSQNWSDNAATAAELVLAGTRNHSYLHFHSSTHNCIYCRNGEQFDTHGNKYW